MLFICCSYAFYILFIYFLYAAHTLFICFSYAVHMLFIYFLYTFHMLFICCSYAFYILFIYFLYAAHTLFICFSYAVHMLFIYFSYAFRILFICFLYAFRMLASYEKPEKPAPASLRQNFGFEWTLIWVLRTLWRVCKVNTSSNDANISSTFMETRQTSSYFFQLDDEEKLNIKANWIMFLNNSLVHTGHQASRYNYQPLLHSHWHKYKLYTAFRLGSRFYV